IPEVKYFHMVNGVYDIIVKIEAKSIEQLKDIIGKKIRPLDHIKSTLTMLVIE
ncbi:unnamed protein product, partial [marine sediment metagenome]